MHVCDRATGARYTLSGPSDDCRLVSWTIASEGDFVTEARGMARKVFVLAWPVALSYIAVGLACGVLEAKAGMAPWMAFVLGCTFLSGAGQFMMSNLWMAGVPMTSILVSVATISSRFALYSASLAPQLSRVPRRLALGVCATLTEESFGINMTKLMNDDEWTESHALLFNIVLLFAWGGSCGVGAAIGVAVTIPTAVACFVMTSLFVFLLCTQKLSMPVAAAILVAFGVVALFKYAGLTAFAVPVAAVAGVAAALVVDGLMLQGVRDAR